MNPLYASGLLAAGLVLSNVVHAHIGIHADGSFETGLMHPFCGLDHMLALLAVGLWAAQAGGRNLIVVPVTFMVAMALGTWLGIAGGYLPLAQEGVAASVVMFGLLVAFAVRGAWQWVAPLVATFALFHGYAHGTEIPQFVSPGGYLAGILLATLALHAGGAAAAITLLSRTLVLRAGGAAIALGGLWMALGA